MIWHGPLPHFKTTSGNDVAIWLESPVKHAGLMNRETTRSWSPSKDLHYHGAVNDRTALFLLCLQMKRDTETRASRQYLGWWCLVLVVVRYMMIYVGTLFSFCLFRYVAFRIVICVVQWIQCRKDVPANVGMYGKHAYVSTLTPLQIQHQRVLNEQVLDTLVNNLIG